MANNHYESNAPSFCQPITDQPANSEYDQLAPIFGSSVLTFGQTIVTQSVSRRK